MKYRIIPCLVVVFLIICGHVIKLIRIGQYRKRKGFTIDFNNDFFTLVNNIFDTNRINQELYAKCMHDVDKIQEELEEDGIVAEFSDPLKGMRGRNYQLFMNIMPELRSMISMDTPMIRERVNQLVGLCDDALKRHIGNLDRAIELAEKGLFNPFACFGEGIRWLVGLPFDILSWCGLLSKEHSIGIKANVFFKLISNIIVFIGLISSIISIVIGWDQFVEKLYKFL